MSKKNYEPQAVNGNEVKRTLRGFVYVVHAISRCPDIRAVMLHLVLDERPDEPGVKVHEEFPKMPEIQVRNVPKGDGERIAQDLEEAMTAMGPALSKMLREFDDKDKGKKKQDIPYYSVLMSEDHYRENGLLVGDRVTGGILKQQPEAQDGGKGG